MGRIFGIDGQLIFDACVLALNIFILFIFLSYLLFNPVRDMLKKRQQKITDDRESAEKEREAANALREEYEQKISAANAEAESILDDARKKALKNKESIIGEAREEASRITAQAQKEAELEKNKARDEIKNEIILISTMMANKLVKTAIDSEAQDKLIDETLREIGGGVWQS